MSADAAKWIGHVVREMCPKAKLCIDPFHVVSWATKALDEVRRRMWRELRKKGESDRVKGLKGSRWALMKNPGDLSRKQKRKLSDIETDNRPLFLAYLMKELATSSNSGTGKGPFMLSDWIEWVMRRAASRSRRSRAASGTTTASARRLLNQQPSP